MRRAERCPCPAGDVVSIRREQSAAGGAQLSERPLECLGERATLTDRWGILLVTLLSAGVACHDSGVVSLPGIPCDTASTCPSDMPPTQADIDTCNAALSGPCGRQYQSYHDCYGDERVCAFNGTTDVAATQQACLEEALAVEACGDGGKGD
jgi:hypothetical protein